MSVLRWNTLTTFMSHTSLEVIENSQVWILTYESKSTICYCIPLINLARFISRCVYHLIIVRSIWRFYLHLGEHPKYTYLLMNNNRCVQITYGKIMNAMLLSVDLVDSISHIIVIVDKKHSSCWWWMCSPSDLD